MICRACNKDLPDDCFSWLNKSAGKRHTICKECKKRVDNKLYKSSSERRQCVRIARKTQIERNKEFVEQYLATHPCVDCPESDTVVLEFDHVRGTKIDGVCELMWRGRSIEVISNEIAKCEVRCANCHRKITHKRRVSSEVERLAED